MSIWTRARLGTPTQGLPLFRGSGTTARRSSSASCRKNTSRWASYTATHPTTRPVSGMTPHCRQKLTATQRLSQRRARVRFKSCRRKISAFGTSAAATCGEGRDALARCAPRHIRQTGRPGEDFHRDLSAFTEVFAPVRAPARPAMAGVAGAEGQRWEAFKSALDPNTAGPWMHGDVARVSELQVRKGRRSHAVLANAAQTTTTAPSLPPEE